jgi:hypothetical protein
VSRPFRAAALATASALACHATPACAHAVAGVRVFPVTLTLDDPGVADEATLPQVVYQPEPGSSLTQFQYEYDKTITPDTALIFNNGYDWLHAKGTKDRSGFENVVLTGKWQAWVQPEHEFILSLGVQEELGGGYATQNIGGDAHGATAPTIYFGKGAGDLPIGYFRPLAVTGELSYAIPDRRLNAAADNNGSPTSWTGGLSVQYSLPYLQSQVKDFGLPDLLGRLIPLVELSYFSPASKAPGTPASLTYAAGAIWLGDTYQVGLEALIPGNRAAGANVGGVVQVHYFFDDIFPDSIGRPLLDW